MELTTGREAEVPLFLYIVIEDRKPTPTYLVSAPLFLFYTTPVVSMLSDYIYP
jgi:hypothetical protein